MTTTTVAAPVRPFVAAPVLAEAQAEEQRIESALAEVDAELTGLDLPSHIGAMSKALDDAIDAGDAAAISKAAQALQAAKTEGDAHGTARMIARGRQRSLRAALVHARVAVGLAQKEQLRQREQRLSDALAKEWAKYETLLAPIIASHLRIAMLSDAIWSARADLVGVRKVNLVTPQTEFALPCPNGPLPNFSNTARPDLQLRRTVDLAEPRPVAHGIPARAWPAADRELVERIRHEIEEV